jgi:hypothetical protein
MSNEKIENKAVLVDGYGVGDVGKKILNERHAMAEGGILVIITTINPETKHIEMDFVSRGLVFQHSLKGFINELREYTQKGASAYFTAMDKEDAKYNIIKKVTRLFEKRMNRDPLIVPHIIIKGESQFSGKIATKQLFSKENPSAQRGNNPQRGNIKQQPPRAVRKDFSPQNKPVVAPVKPQNKSDKAQDILDDFDLKLKEIMDL